jgi:hypothetical protein
MVDVQRHVFPCTSLLMPPASTDSDAVGAYEDAKPLMEYWAEQCMMEIMKVETASNERMEKLENSLEMQLHAALAKHQFQQGLQPSGSAGERYLATMAESGDGERLPHDLGSVQAAMQEKVVSQVMRLDASLEELRQEFAMTRDQSQADREVNEAFRKDVRAEQISAFQDQEQLIEATKIGLDLNLKQGFDCLRSGIEMVQGSTGAMERVESLETLFFNIGHRIDASDLHILDMQEQRANIELTLGELHTRLSAVERAAFEVEEENSLMNRLSVLEVANDPNSSQMTAVFSLISRLEGRLEEMGNVAAAPDASTSQINTNSDIERLTAAVEETQREVQVLAEFVMKEREQRHTAVADVDNMNCVIAKAAASTIERMEHRFAERIGELTGTAIRDYDVCSSGDVHILTRPTPGDVPTAHPSPIDTPLSQKRKINVVEEWMTIEIPRLASLVQLQGQQLEGIDSSTKAAIAKLGEADCELGNRALLLEKAVKVLLEGAHGRAMTITGDDVGTGSRFAATPRGGGTISPVRRMVSVSPPVHRAQSPQVIRSYSQPVMSHESQGEQAGVASMPGLVKFVHKTLGEYGNLDPSALEKILRNDTQALVTRSISPVRVLSRTQSSDPMPSPTMQMSASYCPPSNETRTRSAVLSLSVPASPSLVTSSPRQDATTRRPLQAAPQGSRTGRGGPATSSSTVSGGCRGRPASHSCSMPGSPSLKERPQTSARVQASPRGFEGGRGWIIPRGGNAVVLQDGRGVVRQVADGNHSRKPVVRH